MEHSVLSTLFVGSVACKNFECWYSSDGDLTQALHVLPFKWYWCNPPWMTAEYLSQQSWNSWNFKVVLKLSWILKLSSNFSQWVQMSWYWPLFCPNMWLIAVSDCPVLWDCDNSLFLV